MSISHKEILSTISNLKQLSESNLSNIISIKDISEEIFNITTSRPLPNRISLISKKSTIIIRKENSFINNNKELSQICDKIEIMILSLLKNKNAAEQNIDLDELKKNYQRKNNELEKLRNFNENLNNEINSLKNRLISSCNFGKFSNEELIDIFSVEKFNILFQKKEIKKKKSQPNAIQKDDKSLKTF